MYIGFNEATTWKNATLEEDLFLTEKYCYDYIELRVDKMEDYLKTHNICELKEFFDRSRIKPYALNSLENFNLQNPDKFEEVKSDFIRMCELGDGINCRIIILVPAQNPGNVSSEEIKKDSIKCLNILADIAEKFNIKIGFEFLGFSSSSVNTFKQCYDIVKAVNRDNVGIVIDCCHFYGNGSYLDDLKKADPEKIFALHIDDYPEKNDQMLFDADRIWPGDGVVPLDKILKVLKGINFNKVAALELLNPEYWKCNAEEVIRTGKEKVEAILKNCD